MKKEVKKKGLTLVIIGGILTIIAILGLIFELSITKTYNDLIKQENNLGAALSAIPVVLILILCLLVTAVSSVISIIISIINIAKIKEHQKWSIAYLVITSITFISSLLSFLITVY